VDVDIMDEDDFEDLVMEDDDEVHDEGFLVDLVEVHDEVVLEINIINTKNLRIEIFYLHRNSIYYSTNSISAPRLLNCSTKFGKRRNNGVIALSVLVPGAASAANKSPYAD
jgi:hypothetical protein